MMAQRQQRPACKITVVYTAPPLFVETTQAEFRAVVQRLTSSNNHRNGNNGIKDTINLSLSQSGTSSTELPIIAASKRRRPCACCATAPNRIPGSGSSESPCDTSDDAAARSLIIDADDDYNSASCTKALASCSKKIKVAVCHSDDGADQDITVNKTGEQHQELDIYDIIDDGVYENSVSLLDNILPEASSFTCTPSTSTAATISSSLHAPGSAGSAGPGSPTTDPRGSVIISGSTGQLTAAGHDDDDDEDSLERFYCDPASLPPLVDIVAADKPQQQQQLELFPTFFSSSATSPPLPSYPTTAHWDTLNTSFNWKDDYFLCV